MPQEHYDVVIVGTGAGGGTMAHALSSSGASILLVERGYSVPQEAENWDPAAVWKQLRYRADERWLNDAGREFHPFMHYVVGGNTKFWGSVLYRLRAEDFTGVEHHDGVSPAWPIDYATLAPWYDRAEALFQVHGQAGADPTEPPRTGFPFPPVRHEPRMQLIVDGLLAQGLHPSYLPLGLIRPGEPGGCVLCNTCNSFPCRIHAKSDAELLCVQPALATPGVTLWEGAHADRLITDATGERVQEVEITRKGRTVRVGASTVVVSCGAVNSAALLLRSANDKHRNGLANSSGQVGRRYMAHLATMLEAFHPFEVNPTVFQKTVAVNDFYFAGNGREYPLGHLQSQGRAHGVVAQTVAPSIPVWAYNAWVARGVDWLALSEDLPREENRVCVEPDGRLRVRYRPNNVVPHAELVAEAVRMLRRLGFWKVVTHSFKVQNTTHQCGTLVFGKDPRTSVLDEFCRSHDIGNLFVVDASFFPSSAAVNPGLTIIAQALRVADHLARHDLQHREQLP
ncbi:GMC oxidoreductase [Pedococcus sp. 5OH_020]|uniref:GMC oxidoreductase n=1 Tax=Pedococcus sp. 5OH_020 TaxID=2989814 RepID=UPI0022E9E93C|nr:GMC family oxidoreductase [Pedococcus sp. 5OH_020]